MTYDYHGAFDTHTDFNAPLYLDPAIVTGATGKYYTMKFNITDTTYFETAAAGTYRYKVAGYYKNVDFSWVYGDLSDTLYVTVK
ncbi:MAG: hypothetical protein IJV50_00085 [Lachnospiraceae bacterium]|nr:hypothetical protein [Lachnospiraceae bacterium]